MKPNEKEKLIKFIELVLFNMNFIKNWIRFTSSKTIQNKSEQFFVEDSTFRSKLIFRSFSSPKHKKWKSFILEN